MTFRGYDWITYNPGRGELTCLRCKQTRKLNSKIFYNEETNESVAFVRKHKRCMTIWDSISKSK
jgi:hypothetical protein